MSLRFENVSLSFREKETEKIILHDFSYAWPDQGLVLLCGPSGRGKSTMLRLLAGLQKPDSGRITGSLTAAFCFQEHRLFPQLTVLRNVTDIAWRKAGVAERQEAAAMLLRLGLNEVEQVLFPAKLSGGMAQRVALARAFCCPADMLLLDEPLKELDAGLRKTVQEIVAAQSAERLVVVTAHEPDEWMAYQPMIVRMDE